MRRAEKAEKFLQARELQTAGIVHSAEAKNSATKQRTGACLKYCETKLEMSLANAILFAIPYHGLDSSCFFISPFPIQQFC